MLVTEWPRDWCEAVDPVEDYVHADSPRRTSRYDRGRVHYFIGRFERNEEVTPISVDSAPFRGWTPLILDGRHRAVAAVHAGVPYIDVSFSGLVSVANYCTGKRKTNPLC